MGFAKGCARGATLRERTLPLNFTMRPAIRRRCAKCVSEFRRGKVDLAVSSGPATRAMTAVTEVPVLFALSGDPVELGLVQSLGQPGGNFTGSTFLSLELAGKRVELLKEVFPNLRKLAVLSTPIIRENNRNGARLRRPPRGWASRRSMFPSSAQTNWTAHSPGGGRAADALLVFPDASRWCIGTKIADYAIAQRLPSMFGWSEYCDAGGLLSYGANQRATYFWLATYADRICAAKSPPIFRSLQPTKFELVVNLRTASSWALNWTNPLSCSAPTR